MITYNLEQLVSVSIVNKELDVEFYYQEAKTTFWFWKTKPGFRYLFNGLGDEDYIYSEEELINEEKRLVEGKLVFNKPYVFLKFSGNVCHKRTFDTYDEAQAFYIHVVNQMPVQLSVECEG